MCAAMPCTQVQCRHSNAARSGVGALVRPGADGADATKDMLGPAALKAGLLKSLLLLLLLAPKKAGTGVAWGGKGLGSGKGSENGKAKGADVNVPWLLCLSAPEAALAGGLLFPGLQEAASTYSLRAAAALAGK